MKKIVSMAIIFLMLLSPFQTDTLAVSMQEQTENSSLKLLQSLNIIQPDVDISRNVLRGEFVKMLISALGLESSSANIRYFKDVNETSEYFYDINLALENGYISGYEGSAFNPDEEILMQDAIKMLVCALGYESQAILQGGYPIGYLIKANELGLLPKGISQTSELSMQACIQIFTQALKAPIMEIDAILSENEITYRKDKTKTILSNRDIAEIKGFMNASSATSLYSTNGAGENKVKIDDSVYYAGETDAQKFLGRKVKAYIDESEVYKPTILYITLQDANDDTIFIVSDEIIHTDTKTTLKYQKNDMIKSADISRGAVVIYNGVYLNEINQVELSTLQMIDEETGKNTEGNLLLIDENGDRIYDYILINEYQTWIVGGAVQDKKTVYDYYNNNNVSFYETDFLTIIYNEEEIEFSEIKEKQTLSVAKSKDGRCATVYVSEIIKVGEISGYEEDKNIIVEGEVIPVTNYYVANRKSKQFPNEIKAGGIGTFYMTAFGKIAGFEINDQTEYYYIIKIAESSSMGEPEIRFFTTAGVFENYKLASKIIIDNTVIAANRILSDDRFIRTNGLTINQLVKVKFDGDKNVKEIHLPKDNTIGETRYDLSAFSLDYKEYGRLKSNGTFSLKFVIPKNMPIITAPAYDEKNPVEIDESTISLRQIKQFSNDSWVSFQLFDVNEYYVPSVAVYNNIVSQSVDIDQRLMIISKIVKQADKDNIPQNVIYGRQNGEEVVITLDEDVVVNQITYDISTDNTNNEIKTKKDVSYLSRGSLIVYNVAANGFVDIVEVILSADSLDKTFSSITPTVGSGRGQERSITFGVPHLIGYTIVCNVDQNEYGSEQTLVYLAPSNVKVIFYNVDRGTIREGSIKEIRTSKYNGNSAHRICIRARYQEVYEIYAYEID